KEIKIYHDEYIKGLSIAYESKLTTLCKVFPHSSNKVKCNSLKLSEDEEIEKVYIRSGDLIDHISFITNKGNTLSAGGIGGGGKLFITPKGFKFIGFEGGYFTNLHFLKVKYKLI